MINLDRITHPLRLAQGSHRPGSGKGCAMNVVSYINGDTEITDYPECSARPLARLVQNVNDRLADGDGFLSPENSVLVLDLGWLTVGTADVAESMKWQWLHDLLVDSEHGVARHARPDGVVAIRRVAGLCARQAAGGVVSREEWREARAAADAYAAANAAADAYAAANAYAAAAAAAAADANANAAANAAADADAAAAAYAAAAAAAAANAAADAYAGAAAAADAAAYAAAYAAADAYAAAAAAAGQARIEHARWAIQHWRDLAGLDTPTDIDPTDINSALAKIHA